MNESRNNSPAMVTGPASRDVVVNGLRLSYLDWSGPAGASCPPAVLLHGVLQTKEGMANLAAHLARRGRVVVPDLRGRGDSDRPADGYDPATMAGDVAALIEALGLDRPVVIGRLHGGLVAYHLAASRPELVRGLILGDTAPEVDERRAERALALIQSLPPRFGSLEEVVAFYLETLLLSEARARHDIPHDLVQDEGGGYRWRHDLALVERIEAASLPRADWEVLARVACPTLLLRGQRGEVPQAMADRVCQVIPPCEVQTIFGARHDVFLGPGCEQAFGAIDLFLMRLRAGSDDGPDPPSSTPAQVVERIVRAVNSRDAEAVTALFAPDGRIVQYGEGGRVREGGIETARAAFGRIFAGSPGAVIEAHDLIVQNGRVACVFSIRDATPAPATEPAVAILAPAFLRVRDGRIAELVSYNLHVPIDQV